MVWERINENKPAICIFVLQAASTVFSAGLDILEMYKPKPERVTTFWTSLQDMWLKLFGSSYPTVAAINVSSVSV
jgi:3,2-trans-enoyl-CoA isomerase